MAATPNSAITITPIVTSIRGLSLRKTGKLVNHDVLTGLIIDGEEDGDGVAAILKGAPPPPPGGDVGNGVGVGVGAVVVRDCSPVLAPLPALLVKKYS